MAGSAKFNKVKQRDIMFSFSLFNQFVCSGSMSIFLRKSSPKTAQRTFTRLHRTAAGGKVNCL